MDASITIQQLPRALVSTLENRAVARGQSLQEYLHQTLFQLANRSTLEEEALRRQADPAG